MEKPLTAATSGPTSEPLAACTEYERPAATRPCARRCGR